MYFKPQVLQNIFSESDQEKLRQLIDSGNTKKAWIDRDKDRQVNRYDDLDSYFSKLLEPLARKIFNDPTLKSTYSVYFNYNKATSHLPGHRDTNACRYTIDFCLSAKTPWGIVIGGEEVMFSPGEAVAFMGGEDMHGRGPMPDAENNQVEVVMFHFCPEDHWYFTEGPEYIYYLNDNGFLDNKDSYYLSPKKLNK